MPPYQDEFLLRLRSNFFEDPHNEDLVIEYHSSEEQETWAEKYPNETTSLDETAEPYLNKDTFELLPIHSVSDDEEEAYCVSSMDPQSERRVKFASHAQLFEIEGRNTYSRQERFACWYTRSEYQMIEDGIQDTIRRSALNALIDGEDCLRGLEPKLRHLPNYFQLARCKTTSRRLVLKEQEKQRNCELSRNPVLLRAAYEPFACLSSNAASERGSRDATEVEEINNSMVDSSSPMRISTLTTNSSLLSKPALWFAAYMLREATAFCFQR